MQILLVTKCRTTAAKSCRGTQERVTEESSSRTLESGQAIVTSVQGRAHKDLLRELARGALPIVSSTGAGCGLVHGEFAWLLSQSK
ncbi:hypothetical protein DZC30_12225 [Comamonas testosteroni]|uniref:Uncharacterized protein n=1 Tax=Comamonas testosteroni TaxID=285 RepID=A0A373FNB9_COMTE|nr:hypothetical protein DZC30_12225 [Comamonas testosteroni]